MAPDETERYMNIKATSRFWEGKKGSNISFLYPAIYTITCRLNIRYFPYDQQASFRDSISILDFAQNGFA
jgi:nicotinic acetylcholine receptor